MTPNTCSGIIRPWVEHVFGVGGYSHRTAWPQKSSGYPLTISVDASAGGRHQVFLFALKVTAKPAP